MLRAISEPDWKVFRRLQPVALDRFCQRVLAEIDAIASDDSKTNHERYLDIFKSSSSETVNWRTRSTACPDPGRWNN